jgi:glycosyltransferase involved in cell wall biosynthesis
MGLELLGMSNSSHKIGLVGHPYAPTGRGEDIRCTYRALRSVANKPALRDIYGLIAPDNDELIEFSSACTDKPSDINIFHINGDEVDRSLAHLSYHRKWSGYNIIYPAWELERYPDVWATQLDRFDEIWAPSRFIQTALQSVCKRPVIHMPLASEVLLTTFLGRRYFGIPESDYVFLFFFDVRSFYTRKNPCGVIEAFQKMLTKRPFAKTRLVLKIHGSENDPQVIAKLQNALIDVIDHVTFINRVMSDNEVKNLVRCCDCFISLHRSEGYGRGIAEAMYLGKPVIATAYSGNMDFMTGDNSLEVGYQLVPVGDGEYPHWQNQAWANPDVDQATNHMITLIENPSSGRALGRQASVHIRTEFGYRTSGIRYRQRLEEIAE